MSHQKDKHYWTQLRSALTAGQWSAQYPAKAINGIALSWSELFRKFNKHCRGFNDVSEIASQTQALALLLSANSKDEDQDDIVEGTHYPLNLGDECVLPEERVEEASGGYEVLKRLESSNFDTLNFALAYYAYALGNPAECLDHLEKVPNIVQLNHVPAQSSTRSSTTGLLVPGSEVAPSFSSAGGSFASLAESSAPEIRDGRGWAVTETLRSICLQGMCHEKLSPSDVRKALEIYGLALPLLTMTMSEITPPPVSTISGKIDITFFTQYRELWRWVERLIWRATVLSSRISNVHEDSSRGDPTSIWTWLGQYSVCSVYWPANFRTVHRSTISSLYLRALILKHGHKPNNLSPLPDPQKSPPPWLPSARTVVNDYRAILSISTTFPRAGQRNVKVEDFIDLCVGVWEAGGAIGDHAGWVLDVLWWATRLTFNSHRILRHMTRLLYASGDMSLAKRTLRLYIQVVGKAWQANGETLGDDTDDNDSWVETLIAGARMLCKSASVSPELEGIKDAREAGICIERARTRLDKNNTQLVARVDLAEGIWHSVMALAEQDPHTRPKHLSDAHSFFLQSIETHPTPPAFFHLALSFARPGPSQDLSLAIENAGLAVEGDATEIRYWHLLGLLLAATEQWKAASEILERGAELSETDQENEGNGNDANSTINGGTLETDVQTLRAPASTFTNGNSIEPNGIAETTQNGTSDPGSTTITPNGVPHSIRNGSVDPNPKLNSPPLYVLDKDIVELPAPFHLLNPVADHLTPSRQDTIEYALQLRMTQVTLTETMEGPEGAELRWLEIFSWIAEQKGSPSETPSRPSMDGGRFSAEKSPSFVLSPPSIHQVHEAPIPIPAPTLSEKVSHNELQPMPIPITVSPATPDDEAPPRRSSSEKNERKTQGGLRVKRSSSIDRDTSKSKKVQQMLKNRVHKGQARITTISRKIGNGVVRNGSLKRSSSAPDFHFVLRQTSYQASSIHSRRRVSSIIHHHDDRTPTDSPPPPPPPIPPPQETNRNTRIARSNHLLANLWLMSAATFRRLGKIEQARGAIQEAEVRDEANPAVWVQLGLYYVALGQEAHAIDAFQKALFISPDDIAATIHLARLHLSIDELGKAPNLDDRCSNNVDLAAGMLSHLTRGNGWDVPEAWYFLAKAYGMQGRKEMERECLSFALGLSETRGIRDIGTAVGWCI